MKYAIFSVDESRLDYRANMERQLTSPLWEKLYMKCVDGRDPKQLATAQQLHTYDVKFPDAQVGHLGIWYTVLRALQSAPLVTFEDDAILHPEFTSQFQARASFLPEDFDFFTLFLPRDSNHMFDKQLHTVTNAPLSKIYQRYGGVSMYYSKRGSYNIQRLLRRDGITGQYDDTLMAYAKAGELNGYGSHPNLPDLVSISGTEKSIVQESARYARISG